MYCCMLAVSWKVPPSFSPFSFRSRSYDLPSSLPFPPPSLFSSFPWPLPLSFSLSPSPSLLPLSPPQEGSGLCLFCGTLVCTPEEEEMLTRDSKKGHKMREQLLRQFEMKVRTPTTYVGPGETENKFLYTSHTLLSSPSLNPRPSGRRKLIFHFCSVCGCSTRAIKNDLLKFDFCPSC